MKAADRKTLIKAVDIALERTLSGANHPSHRRFHDRISTERLSCCAVFEALKFLNLEKNSWGGYEVDYDNVYRLEKEYDKVITKLGLDTESNMYYNAFKEIPKGRQRQQARALWLTFVKTALEEKLV